MLVTFVYLVCIQLMCFICRVFFFLDTWVINSNNRVSILFLIDTEKKCSLYLQNIIKKMRTQTSEQNTSFGFK